MPSRVSKLRLSNCTCAEDCGHVNVTLPFSLHYIYDRLDVNDLAGLTIDDFRRVLRIQKGCLNEVFEAIEEALDSHTLSATRERGSQAMAKLIVDTVEAMRDDFGPDPGPNRFEKYGYESNRVYFEAALLGVTIYCQLWRLERRKIDSLTVSAKDWKMILNNLVSKKRAAFTRQMSRAITERAISVASRELVVVRDLSVPEGSLDSGLDYEESDLSDDELQIMTENVDSLHDQLKQRDIKIQDLKHQIVTLQCDIADLGCGFAATQGVIRGSLAGLEGCLNQSDDFSKAARRRLIDNPIFQSKFGLNRKRKRDTTDHGNKQRITKFRGLEKENVLELPTSVDDVSVNIDDPWAVGF